MREQENNLPFLVTGLLLTLGILVTFQIYIQREPARIERVLAEDRELAYEEGRVQFAENCALCHGENGEGDIGPALNDPEMLVIVNDNTLFSLISSGVPGTAMPAWNQAHGGPFTDEQVRQLVVFVRSWEEAEEAPSVAEEQNSEEAAQEGEGNLANGQTVYESKCIACHGPNGEGEIGPALNDPAKLAQFDDAWYTQVISEGRPAQGMPTWGTVLAPRDIADVVAFIREWEQ